jgi:hypothetical protein
MSTNPRATPMTVIRKCTKIVEVIHHLTVFVHANTLSRQETGITQSILYCFRAGRPGFVSRQSQDFVNFSMNCKTSVRVTGPEGCDCWLVIGSLKDIFNGVHYVRMFCGLGIEKSGWNLSWCILGTTKATAWRGLKAVKCPDCRYLGRDSKLAHPELKEC